MKVLSSQAALGDSRLSFVMYRIDGKLEKGLWRAVLTLAYPQYHQTAPHIRPA